MRRNDVIAPDVTPLLCEEMDRDAVRMIDGYWTLFEDCDGGEILGGIALGRTGKAAERELVRLNAPDAEGE